VEGHSNWTRSQILTNFVGVIRNGPRAGSGACFLICLWALSGTPGHAYRLFQSNPAHRGLQFKKLEGEDDIYSARIGLGYRALAVVKEDRTV
jgi:hypothetical protein